MESKVEVKKVDPQGRVILPADWRQSEMKESREIYIIREKGYLKIIPKRKVDLTEYFDKVDLNVEAIENWKKFEKRLYRSRS
jgi:bifunctional DNA-binding transcriptional regulator/antitoxin component of YhaV-PrlF toxin-antitoxin module